MYFGKLYAKFLEKHPSMRIYGHNRELMEKSKTLYGYAYLVSMIRRFEKELDTASAVNKAVDRCIKEGILTEYLSRHKTEVVGMLTKEYSEKEVAEMFYEDGLETGLEKGLEQGLERGREEGREQLLAELLSQGFLTSDAVSQFRQGRVPVSSDKT